MSDIFIPESKPEDALVSPLHSVTYATSDPDLLERIFTEGYGLTQSGWTDCSDADAEYLGFGNTGPVKANCFTRTGAGANVQIRVLAVSDKLPQIRPAISGLYPGCATISFPIDDLREHEKRMAGIGVESTIGVKEMEFTSPQGETYVSAEIVYKAAEHCFVMGVRRPDGFVPVGPMNDAEGIGGCAYSARCLTNCDASIAFVRDVLGYEIRRDIVLEVGERSALLMPQGTKERFVQAFAPGAGSGYLILMDHGPATKPSPVEQFGPPARGLVMYSFSTHDLDEVMARAKAANVTVSQPAETRSSPGLPERAHSHSARS